jgi:phosphonate transport system substrate-binding protein
MSMRSNVIAGVLAAVLSAASANAQEVNFGVISTEAASNLRSVWDPFIRDMQKKTGLQVRAFFASGLRWRD